MWKRCLLDKDDSSVSVRGPGDTQTHVHNNKAACVLTRRAHAQLHDHTRTRGMGGERGGGVGEWMIFAHVPIPGRVRHRHFLQATQPPASSYYSTGPCSCLTLSRACVRVCVWRGQLIGGKFGWCNSAPVWTCVCVTKTKETREWKHRLYTIERVEFIHACTQQRRTHSPAPHTSLDFYSLWSHWWLEGQADIRNPEKNDSSLILGP